MVYGLCVWLLSFGLIFIRVSHISAFYSQVIFCCIGITFCLFIHQLMGIPLNFSKEVSVLFFQVVEYDSSIHVLIGRILYKYLIRKGATHSNLFLLLLK